MYGHNLELEVRAARQHARELGEQTKAGLGWPLFRARAEAGERSTATMRLPSCLSAVIMALVTGWLIACLLWAGLSFKLGASDGLVRYPEAARLTPPTFRLQIGAVGQIRQRSVYYTTDAWRQVLAWYARYFDLELNRKPQIRGGCFQIADKAAWSIIRQNVSITLCSRDSSTMIVIDRTLNLHW